MSNAFSIQIVGCPSERARHQGDGNLTCIQSLEVDVYCFVIKCSAQATKSTKVFFLCRYLPSSYHCRPISPPPRTWAMAKMKPRSTNDRRCELKYGSLQISYDPSAAACCSVQYIGPPWQHGAAGCRNLSSLEEDTFLARKAIPGRRDSSCKAFVALPGCMSISKAIRFDLLLFHGHCE